MELIFIYILSVLVTRVVFALTEKPFERFELLISLTPIINILVSIYIMTYGTKEK
jgi:hypothetical protein